MSYDDAINEILKETYFGGAPFEQASGIKKHVTFEASPRSPNLSPGPVGGPTLEGIDDDEEPLSGRETRAISKFLDDVAKYQSKVEIEDLTDRGIQILQFLDTARGIYRSAAGENKLGKVIAGVYRSIADPLSQYILELEYGNLSYDQDMSDQMIDAVLETFITKQGEMAKGTDEESVIEATLQAFEDFRQKMSTFNFAQANAELTLLHYDKDIDGYRYQYCGECKEDGKPVRVRTREADHVRGIEAEWATGPGWDHNGFRIDAQSSVDLGAKINLYPRGNQDAFEIITLVAPHAIPNRAAAIITTLKV